MAEYYLASFCGQILSDTETTAPPDWSLDLILIQIEKFSRIILSFSAPFYLLFQIMYLSVFQGSIYSRLSRKPSLVLNGVEGFNVVGFTDAGFKVVILEATSFHILTTLYLFPNCSFKPLSMQTFFILIDYAFVRLPKSEHLAP